MTRPTSLEMLRTGIITTYLSLRSLVIRGFLDIYPEPAGPGLLVKPASGLKGNVATDRRLILFGLGFGME